MKLKTFLMGSLILFSTLSHAQLRTGVQLGTGYSGVFSKSAQKGQMMLSAGFVGEYKLSAGLVLHGELNYVNKGAELINPEKQQWNGIINRYEFHLHYIELPLSVGYAIPAGRKVITPRAGVYAAYGLGGYGHLTSENFSTGSTPNTLRISPFKVTEGKILNQEGQYFFDAFQRTEIGALIGLDLDLSSHVRISLNTQMHIGYPLADYSEAGSVRFKTARVSVGYMF